jgi:Beta-glucosidase-related glycosidases
MSRSYRAAGMVMGGLDLPSLENDRIAAELLGSYAAAGIRAYLLPGSLASEPRRLSSLATACRRASEGAGLGRALVAIGGSSSPSFGLPPFPLVPSPLGIASSRSRAVARRAGRAQGLALAACGLDLVLGPRFDLASDPKNPSGVLDGFGEDGRLAGQLGVAYARALMRSGIGACAGRFPGLGSVCSDCYEGMAFVELPVERLERCEMRPFARAIAAGLPAVLVGRVLVPALESEHIPASASARVIEGRLREAFGFRGLVIGDDIGPKEDAARAAVLGALAGCDLNLLSRPAAALAAAAALEKAAAGGELPLVRAEMSRRRLDRFLFHSRQRRIRYAAGGEALEPQPVPEALLRKTENDIEDCISLLAGSLELETMKGGALEQLLVLAFVPSEGAPGAEEIEPTLETLRSGLPGAFVASLPGDADPGRAGALLAALDSRGPFSEALILTYDAHFHPAQEGIARLIEERVPRFVVVAMRDPYDAAFFPDAAGLAAAYGFSSLAVRALIKLLSGEAKASGGRPVEVIGLEI